MKIIDMHMHTHAATPISDAKILLENLEKAGIYGAAVFSITTGAPPFNGLDPIEKRIDDITKLCSQAPDRLYPVLHIHPCEDNIEDGIKLAAEKGIVAYKMICNTYYIGEDKPMKLLEMMAKLNKPVIFHSGILWDGLVSSQYNKPINWEALLEIPNLKFSMGHCSWPWIDECIALYGKFLNAYSRNSSISSEMFFDITPGTPELYRRELFDKLFNIGYDVGNNIMFGLDNRASDYNYNRAKDWLELDKKIMDEFNVPNNIREKMYRDNFLRFIGKRDEKINHILPIADSSVKWKV